VVEVKHIIRAAIAIAIVAALGDYLDWSRVLTISACVWVGFVVIYMSTIMSIPGREVSTRGSYQPIREKKGGQHGKRS
jgi:hypothetical protein